MKTAECNTEKIAVFEKNKAVHSRLKSTSDSIFISNKQLGPLRYRIDILPLKPNPLIVEVDPTESIINFLSKRKEKWMCLPKGYSLYFIYKSVYSNEDIGRILTKIDLENRSAKVRTKKERSLIQQ